jgi:hypothetical protein
MKKLLFCFAAIMALSGIAAADGVCVSAVIDVTITPGESFACGSLIFSDFYLTDLTGGLTGTLDINSVSINSQGLVTLEANPNLNVGGSENLSFTVSGTLNSFSLAKSAAPLPPLRKGSAPMRSPPAETQPTCARMLRKVLTWRRWAS